MAEHKQQHNLFDIVLQPTIAFPLPVTFNCSTCSSKALLTLQKFLLASWRVAWCLQVKHDDLKEAAQRFVEELAAGKEFIADHKPAQTEVLDAGIKTVQEELASLLGSLHEGLYVDAGSPPADVVNALEQLQERLAQLKVRILPTLCSTCWLTPQI